MMRRAILVAAVLLVASAGSVSAQSFLNKIKNSSVVSSVANTLTGTTTVTASSIIGTWTYVSPAVSLVSDDVLEKTAATVAASAVEPKLQDIFTQVGITEGSLAFTFNEDNTFTCLINGKSASGTYTFISDPTGVLLTFSVGGMIDLGSLNMTMTSTSGNLSMLLTTDQLMNFLTTFSEDIDTTLIAQLKAATSAYNNIMVGFKMSN